MFTELHSIYSLFFYLLTLFLCRVFKRTLVHELQILYRHTKWSLLGPKFRLPKTIIIFIISVSMERFRWQHVQWCGTDGLYELGQCFLVGLIELPLSCLSFSVFSLSSLCWSASWGWGLLTKNLHLLSRSLAMTTFLKKIIRIFDLENYNNLAKK